MDVDSRWWRRRLPEPDRSDLITTSSIQNLRTTDAAVQPRNRRGAKREADPGRRTRRWCGGGGGGGGEPGGEAPAGPPDPTGGRGNIINPIPGATVQFNWNTPMRLSPHNPSTLMVGGRSLFISRDRGTSWTMTKELGKGINLTARQLMGVQYSLPSCSGRGGGGGPGVACILSKNDGYVLERVRHDDRARGIADHSRHSSGRAPTTETSS
jgi:hypothetical protein